VTSTIFHRGNVASAAKWSCHMDEFSTTGDNLNQTDEDILTYTVSDEALEAAAGIEAEPADVVGCAAVSEGPPPLHRAQAQSVAHTAKFTAGHNDLPPT
jgi:hypothetical protein